MNQFRANLARLSGSQVDDEAWERLSRLRAWLIDEAIAAGGLGANEARVIDERHILDSAMYAVAWPTPPVTCWDLGTGVGLPGLVLAILWPRSRMVLIDRSAKRIGLARRAARILDLEVDTVIADIRELQGPMPAIVSRATITAHEFRPLLFELLAPAGRAVISGSAGVIPTGYSALEIDVGHTILDPPPRLLMMDVT